MSARKTLDHEIKLEIERVTLRAFLHVPDEAKGLVLFAHGSGSGRNSPRNQLVARYLSEGKMATCLMDLLTDEEEALDMKTRELRFNIPFLALRLGLATEWAKHYSETKDLEIGYFGASTGAAAALIAAAERGNKIKAVVSRGGRPDLAASQLSHVVSPTLLIVGENDHGVIELNQKAFDLLNCPKKLEIVPGATHLFEEPGTLEHAAKLALGWFTHYF